MSVEALAAERIEPRQRMGAPSKFTPERRKKILGAIKAGNYTRVAVTAAGVGIGTYYSWVREGRLAAAKFDAGQELSAREQEFYEFAMELVQAEAEAEVRLVTLISVAAADDWRAADKLLTKRWAGRWKDVTATELSGPDGMPLSTAPGQVDDDGIAALARELATRVTSIQAGTDEILDAEIIEDDGESATG